jgi:hypothetical protein
MGVISIRTSLPKTQVNSNKPTKKRAQHVLDGFYADLRNVGFPREAPLVVVEKEPIMSTRAKGHRIFIKDKQDNNGSGEIIENVTKLLNGNLNKKIIRGIKSIEIKSINIASQQWVCAYPAQHQGGCGRRNYLDGYIHRDVREEHTHPWEEGGILSCIVFNDDAESGGVKIWFDSHDYCSKSLDFQQHKSSKKSHIERYLDRHYHWKVIKPRRNTAIIFDGRLLHKSLSHNENYQRLAYSFFVCINGCEVDDKMDYMSKVQYTWVNSGLIKNRTMADSGEKMTLRSSRK